MLQGPNFWEIAGDCMQIVLCLLILFFFIRNRFHKKSPAPKKPANIVGNSFNEQVLTQAVQQQIDQAFNNIIESMNTERENLERILGINQKGRGGSVAPSRQPISRAPQSPVGQRSSDDHQRASDETAGDDRRREIISKLSAKGLDARQISGELKIPINEIELILSLQKE